MTFEGDGGATTIPQHRGVPHYHGDEVRLLFMLAALLIIFAQSTGAELPFSTFGAVTSAAALVIAAGITSPRLGWIHWVNAAFSVLGSLIFGVTAVNHYRAGVSFFEGSFIYVEALALIALIALYFTTRTIRGILLRPYHHH